ncbi:MAG: 1-acyl-sn-glycerol-3-phosphate acyltransferase [Candidatus Thiodiazotropha endolucinida]
MEKWSSESIYTISAWILQLLSYPLCRWYFFRLKKWRINGGSHCSEVAKPLIIAAAPHLSHFDVVVVPAAVPPSLLPVRWLADEKIFTGRAKSVWLRLWGAIPIKRDPQGSFEDRDIDGILRFVLRKKKSVGLFPECCLVGGRFNHYHRDIIASALEQNISVLPVAISNDLNLNMKRPVTDGVMTENMSVSIGKPLLTATDLLDALAS